MKGKIKKIFKWLIRIAEIATVIWSANGMMRGYRSCVMLQGCDYQISPVWAYFLSAVLILYLLRRYDRARVQ